MSKPAGARDDGRGHQDHAEDQDPALEEGRPGYGVEPPNDRVGGDDDPGDQERLPVRDTEEPDKHDADRGVLPHKVDQRDDDARNGREAPERPRALEPFRKVVLDGQVAPLLPDGVQFHPKDDDAERGRERDEDLLPDARPARRIPKPADAEQAHPAADRADDQDRKDPEPERPPGKDVVFSVMDLFGGPAPDADEHDEVQPDQGECYDIRHQGASLNRSPQRVSTTMTRATAPLTMSPVWKGNPNNMLC